MMFGTTSAADNSVLLLQDLGLPTDQISQTLQLLARTNARYLKDVKININNALNTESLSKKEAYLIAAAAAFNEGKTNLQEAFQKSAVKEGATDAEIAEAISCASLMNANNVYYRFRHFMNEEFYSNAPAGIRMSIMANPVLGKELFELVSLVISAMNGCQMCVVSHEKNLIAHGSSKQRVHDAVRLGAVVKSLATLL
ncbi:MAG TPA: carboxymuconolactone decarboxylase family protein [Parasegetibacter sp.]